MRTFRILPLSILAVVGIGLISCGESKQPEKTAEKPAPAVVAEKMPHGCGKVDVPPGDFDLPGDPAACKGGTFITWTNSYPTHLNFYGPERDTTLASIYVEAMFNSLVTVQQNSLEVIPELASSWEVKDGGKEITFKIDPDAKWSDGKPVTSKDVLATYDLLMHPKVVEVVLKGEFDDFERPEAIDERTVRFKTDKASWRNILKFDGFYIYPAHAINPETYLEDWRFAVPVNSGQYTLGEYETGKYLKLERRKDFWGAKKRQFIGTGNFDTLYFKFIRDADLAFEHIKKGDIDFYLVTRAQRWAEELDFDKIKKGQLKKMKMYHKQPQVPSQMAFNLTDPVFKDVRVRKALMYLYNREYLHDQIFYNQYTNKNSYWANSIYQNPNNEKITFDPEKGVALLREAGWTKKDKDGVLMNEEGKRLEFEFLYIHASAERVYTPIQETFRKYGVKMNLKLISPSAWIKATEKKDFQVTYINWGSSPFPNPRLIWHSEEADKDNTSNITHYKNKRVDELIDLYDVEPDLKKRAAYIREMDGIIYKDFPYLLDWYSPTFRLLWWDKFGMPEWVSYNSEDIRMTHWKTWWYQPERAERLKKARAENRALELAPPENTYWR